jgi:hypothetical protein
LEESGVIDGDRRKRAENLEDYLIRYSKFRAAQGLGISFGINDLTNDEIEAFSIIHQKILESKGAGNGRGNKINANT